MVTFEFVDICYDPGCSEQEERVIEARVGLVLTERSNGLRRGGHCHHRVVVPGDIRSHVVWRSAFKEATLYLRANDRAAVEKIKALNEFRWAWEVAEELNNFEKITDAIHEPHA